MSFKSDGPEMGNGPYSTPLIVGTVVHDRLSRVACNASKRGRASSSGRSSSGRIITDASHVRLCFEPHRRRGRGDRTGRGPGKA